jgi:hypothetical protein
MNRLCIALGMCWLLAVPLRTFAQAPSATAPAAATVAPADLKAMYEDIEILRRIMNRDLQRHQCASCHSSPRALAFSPDGRALAVQTDASVNVAQLWQMAPAGHGDLAHQFTGAEGSYLKGFGVVYSITLPPIPGAKQTSPSEPVTKPLSDWDRVRKQLRGEKVEPTPAPPRREPGLIDVVLKSFADNGRHFTHLGPTESLTLVITFRPVKASAGPATMGSPAMAPGLQGFNLPQPVRLWDSTGKPKTSSRHTPLGNEIIYSFPTQPGVPANPTSARDFELLADLQCKQGRAEEAIRAYQKALDLASASKDLAGLSRKLAKAYLMADRDADARTALDRALHYLREAQKGENPSPSASGLESALPSQLIVSVPKTVLEQFAKVGMTMEEFRRAAHVEWRTFSAAAQKETVP